MLNNSKSGELDKFWKMKKPNWVFFQIQQFRPLGLKTYWKQQIGGGQHIYDLSIHCTTNLSSNPHLQNLKNLLMWPMSKFFQFTKIGPFCQPNLLIPPNTWWTAYIWPLYPQETPIWDQIFTFKFFKNLLMWPWSNFVQFTKLDLFTQPNLLVPLNTWRTTHILPSHLLESPIWAQNFHVEKMDEILFAALFSNILQTNNYPPLCTQSNQTEMFSSGGAQTISSKIREN